MSDGWADNGGRMGCIGMVVGKGDVLSGDNGCWGKLAERDKFDVVDDGPADTEEIDAEMGDAV